MVAAICLDSSLTGTVCTGSHPHFGSFGDLICTQRMFLVKENQCSRLPVIEEAQQSSGGYHIWFVFAIKIT